jgi:hypothetical protein
MNLREVGCGDTDWMDLLRIGHVLVNAVMNFRVP